MSGSSVTKRGILRKIWGERFLPKLYDRSVRGMKIESKREEICQYLQGDVLEIGIGTGLNLPFYPDSVGSITGIDPNPGMNRQLEKKLKLMRKPVRVVCSGAESLPFENESFDCVLSTISLCSIERLGDAFSELRRVLRKTGKFYFIEHGLSPDEKIARWQHRLNPIQKVIGDGCQLVIRVESEIQRAGFEIESIQNFHIKGPKTHTYMYQGVAVPRLV